MRAEDRQRIDQALAGSTVDAIPVRVEVARGEIILERGEKTRAIDLLLAAAGDEVVGEGCAVDLADPERRVAGDIGADDKSGDARQRDHDAAVVVLGEGEKSPGAAHRAKGETPALG